MAAATSEVCVLLVMTGVGVAGGGNGVDVFVPAARAGTAKIESESSIETPIEFCAAISAPGFHLCPG